MDSKKKKILVAVAAVVLVLLLTAMILLICLLPKKDNTPPVDDQQTSQGGNEGDEGDDKKPGEEEKPTVDEYKYSTPSAIELTASKTELTAGDTFTLTVEVLTNRTDMCWAAMDFVIGPMVDTTTTSADIATSFEVVTVDVDGEQIPKIDIPNFNDETGWVDNTTPLFDSKNGTAGIRVCLSFNAAKDKRMSTTEKFVLTAEIKVKETATYTGSFSFGITDTKNNLIAYFQDDSVKMVQDHAGKGITTQELTLSIKAKSN